MTVRERVRRTLRFEKCDDRLPAIEWAGWWDKTWDRWISEGLPGMSWERSQEYFGLDPMPMIYGACANSEVRPAYHGGPLITDKAQYEDLRPLLMSDKKIQDVVERAKNLKFEHDRGNIAVRLHIDGFFSLPRRFFGITGHFYAFYDHPELMHRMNRDCVEFNLRLLDAIFAVLTPDIVDFVEDMSYNNGPMLSTGMFREFLLPYYLQVVPAIKASGAKVFVDSDGDVTQMIPWFYEAGVEGVFPLERQAGVDITELRRQYPGFLMLGGYDKMVMPLGEAAMRAEFERILPAMRSGGYIPSVDHQTPPGVSLENYKIYVSLLKEYCHKAV